MRKVGAKKNESGALGDEETEIDPYEGIERAENDLQRDEATSGPLGPTSARATNTIST